jgi:hypothetical protein
MTKDEVAAVIAKVGRELAPRVTGNEENAILAEKIAALIPNARPAVVDLMRDWLSVRLPQATRKPGDGIAEGRMWLALEVACKCRLGELRPDAELLVKDVVEGKTFLPYYADMITNYLDRIPLYDP